MKQIIRNSILIIFMGLICNTVSSQGKAIIKIDIDRTIGKINPNIYGSFVEPLFDIVYGRLYDPSSPFSNEDGFRKDLIELAKELHVPVIRWPGGNYVSGYCWEDGIGPKANRPVRMELAWDTIDNNHMGTDEYAKFCKLINAENFVCINAGTGTLDEARHWVEYCNVEKGTYYSDLRLKNGVEKPYNIKYWALGNEIDGWWQMGHKNAEDYCKFAKEAAKLMKWTDKNISLIASGASDYNPNNRWIDWNRQVINGLVDYIDYVSMHRYVEKGDNFQEFMTAGMDLDQKIGIVKGQIQEALVKYKKEKDIYISFDEWAAQGETLSSMLVLAQHLNSFVRNADVVKMANFTLLTTLMGFDRTKGFYKSALYHAFSLFSNNCFGESLDVYTSCATYDINRFKNVPYLDVTAAYQKEKGQLVINVVNRHETDAIKASILSQSKEFGSEASVYELNGASIGSVNTFDEQNIKISKTGIKVKGNEIKHVFPAHSFTMLIIKEKQ